MSKIIPVRKPFEPHALTRSFDRDGGNDVIRAMLPEPSSTRYHELPITMGGWMKVDENLNSSMCSMVVGNGPNNQLWIRANFNLAYYRVYYRSQATDGSTPIVVGDWQHVIAQLTSTHRRIFVNGNLDGETAASHAPYATPTDRIQFGNVLGGTSYAWVGDLRDIVFYDAELTEGQVNALYKGADPRNVQSSALRSYWRFNRGIDEDIYGQTKLSIVEGTPTWAQSALPSWSAAPYRRTRYVPIPAEAPEYKPKHPDIFASPIIGT